MAKLTNAQKKEWARTLFCKEGLTAINELATKVGVTPKTMSKWITEGQWRTLKRSLLLTRQEQLVMLYTELEQINNHIQSKAEGSRFADAKEADARRKLVKDIEALETETSLNDIFNVAKVVLEYWREIDLEKTLIITEAFDEVIISKLK